MSKKLFTPGPTNISQNIRVQLAKDIIHHRMDDFHKIFYQVSSKLKQVFNTNGPVLTITSSGTGVMESTVVNLFSKGDTVLVINTGFFGERFIEICSSFELNIIHIDYPWGEGYQLDDVKKIINMNKDIKGVFMTYHETSTGVLNPIKELGDFLRETKTLFIVDCISGLIVHPFLFEEWKVDCAIAASQKGFGLPPGLAFVALSNKAVGSLAQSKLPKYYFSYQKYLDCLKNGESPFTPSISMIMALEAGLDDLLELGIDNIIENKKCLRLYTEEAFKKIGFSLFVPDESIRGNALVPVVLNDNSEVNLEQLVHYLDHRYNLQVAKGQGIYAHQMLRVGLISDFTKTDIDELINCIVVFMNKEKVE